MSASAQTSWGEGVSLADCQNCPHMKNESAQRTTDFLPPRLEGTDSAQIAETVAATWHDIDEALTPIIGPRGVQALFNRSLHLAARTHAWLAVAPVSVRSGLDVAALKPLFAEQHHAEASAAAELLLSTFHDLLASLIGPSLTERLLRSAVTTLLSGPSTKDISP
jgi:hypothetical protein